MKPTWPEYSNLKGTCLFYVKSFEEKDEPDKERWRRKPALVLTTCFCFVAEGLHLEAHTLPETLISWVRRRAGPQTGLQAPRTTALRKPGITETHSLVKGSEHSQHSGAVGGEIFSKLLTCSELEEEPLAPDMLSLPMERSLRGSTKLQVQLFRDRGARRAHGEFESLESTLKFNWMFLSPCLRVF